MNTPTRLLTGLVLAAGLIAPLPAQETPAPAAVEPDDNYPASSPAELDDLLGPIALYPDDLVSLILPAATETTDIVLAARYLDAGGPVDRVDQQPWDESVRAVAHFPEVVTMLNEDLGWTQQVGDEFLLQPAEVMKSIQRLRAKAYAAGTLRDTPQQKVLVDGDVIRIVPATENVVYVPRYRSEVVYVDSPVYYSEPCITFGIGWTIGNWHRWDCDWYNHRVWVYYSHNSWRSHRNYYYRHVHHDYRSHDHDHHDGRAWNPPPRRTRPGYHHRGDGGHDGRRYVGPDRGRDHRDGRNDRRNPGARRSQPSSPTEVVTRDVIANQRNRDRHDNDRASRPHHVTTPATPTARRSTPTTTVTSNTVTNTRRSTTSRNETDRSQTYRSRPETNHERTVTRSVQAYTPERRTPTSTVTARVRNSTPTQVSTNRNSTPTSRVTTSRMESSRNSSAANSNASSNRSSGGSHRSSSSSDSGHSRGSGRGDDGDRSNSGSSRSGRNR